MKMRVSYVSYDSNVILRDEFEAVPVAGVLQELGCTLSLTGSGNTFTVTFEKPGTYDYLCILIRG